MQNKTSDQLFETLQQCGKTIVEQLSYIKENSRLPRAVEASGKAIAKIESAYVLADKALSWFDKEINKKEGMVEDQQRNSSRKEGRQRRELKIVEPQQHYV